MTDSMFSYIVKSKIPELIAQYNASKAPANNSSGSQQPVQNSSGTQSSTSGSEEVTVQKRVFLTFDILSGENNKAILDALSKYKMKATFFLSGNTILSNDDTVRRMTVDGHEVGISGFSNDAQAFSAPETMLSDLSKTNDLLYEVSHIKSHLVRVPNGSKATLSQSCADALINSGYRFWDWTINANGGYTTPSASRISNTVINTLKKQTYAVIRFTDSAQTVSALNKILDYLSDNNCVVSTLSVLDTPTNQLGDRR